MKLKITVTEAGVLEDLADRKDLIRISDEVGVQAIYKHFGNHEDVTWYNAFFVQIIACDYGDIYGIISNMPWIHQKVYKIEMAPA